MVREPGTKAQVLFPHINYYSYFVDCYRFRVSDFTPAP